MFVIRKGPRDALGGVTLRETVPQPFETQEGARDYLRRQVRFQFAKFWQDEESAIWWGRNEGGEHPTGFLIQGV